MPSLPVDALPELLPPRGYVPAASPLPAAGEPLFPIPLPGPSIGIEELPPSAGETEALLEGLLATAVVARARMRWHDAAAVAMLGVAIAEHGGQHGWVGRFTNEAAAARLLAGRPADGELPPVSPPMDDHSRTGEASSELARSWINRAVTEGLAGDPNRALEHLSAAEEALEGGDHFGRLLVLVNRAQALMDAGDLDAAAREAGAALRLARREKQDYWVALASLTVALAQLARGRRNEARARLGDAARLFERFGDGLRQVQCHFLLGEVAWTGEDPIRAGSHYRDALAVARPAEAQAWIELLTLRFEHR